MRIIGSISYAFGICYVTANLIKGSIDGVIDLLIGLGFIILGSILKELFDN